MNIETTDSLFEKIRCAGGKTVAVGCKLSPLSWKDAGMIFAGSENLVFGETIFENISTPLALAGTPWEIARGRIEAEIFHWFGEKNTATFSSRTAEMLSSEERSRLVLARACAANIHSVPVVVSENFPLSGALFKALAKRAQSEGFSLVLENPSAEYFLRADKVFVFGAEPRNLFFGKILGAGAGEFFAKISPEIQIHGKLGENAEENILEGTEIQIFLPPEIFRLDAFPPEENFFELEKPGEGQSGEIFCDGRLFFRDFKIKNSGAALRVASLHRQTLEIPEGGGLFAWFFPEDAIGTLTQTQQ